jgi:NitT/TauT family transport system permease protein/taurine transport system permease protein
MQFAIGRRAWIGTLTIAALLVLWFILTSLTHVIGGGRFPSPVDFWASLQQISTTGYADGTLATHVLHSLKLVVVSFLVAVSIGTPIGLGMGWSPRFEALVSPIFSMLRPIPPLAWIPLAILWLGLGDAAKVLVIFVAAFVPAVINAQAGVRNIEPYLIEASQMLGTHGWRLAWQVLVPGALPMIFTGLRLSLQASWTTLVAAELVGALAGIGRVLNVAAQDIYPGMILIGMASVALLGAATTWALGYFERRIMPWAQGH